MQQHEHRELLRLMENENPTKTSKHDSGEVSAPDSIYQTHHLHEARGWPVTALGCVHSQSNQSVPLETAAGICGFALPCHGG